MLVWSLATALVPVLAGFMPGLLLSRILVLIGFLGYRVYTYKCRLLTNVLLSIFKVGIGEGVSPSAATDLIARHVSLPQHPNLFLDISINFISSINLASILNLHLQNNTLRRALSGCFTRVWWS